MAKDKTKAKESKIIRYFKGVKAEFRKIIWPDRDTMLKQLAAVLIVTVILGALIALLDFGFQNLIDFLTSLSLNS
jgi:preprotein translocase subunit SecE